MTYGIHHHVLSKDFLLDSILDAKSANMVEFGTIDETNSNEGYQANDEPYFPSA